MKSKLFPLPPAIHRSLQALPACAAVVSVMTATPSSGQRAGNQFDPDAQKRILREYAGPTALCQELKTGLECKEEFPEYAVAAGGTALTTVAILSFSKSGAGSEAAVPRLYQFAAHFGFSRDETHGCATKALKTAAETHGNGFEDVVNSNYKMHCRGWQTQIDLVITLTPKSSF